MLMWRPLCLSLMLTTFIASCGRDTGSSKKMLKNDQVQGLQLRGLVQQYDYARFNALVESKSADLTSGAVDLVSGRRKWSIKPKVQNVEGKPFAKDYTLHFTLERDDMPQAAVLAELVFDEWDSAAYVLMPGCAYNGNRFISRKIRYSPKLMDPRDIGKEVPTIITDVPRLNIGDGPSEIEERSGAMTTPSIAFFNPKTQKSIVVLFEQGNAYGDYGVQIEETRDREKCFIRLQSPVVRERTMYKITNNDYPSQDVPADFQKGDTVAISFRVYEQDCQSIEQLYEQFFELRKDLFPKQETPKVLPSSAAFAVQETKFNEENFVPKWGYYAVGMRENFLQDWQIGWTGGMISTYPLLFAGNKKTRQQVLANFDWLYPDGFAPSGYFWDAGEEGDKWYGGDIRKPHTKDWHLVRKSGDGLYFVLKQLMLMDSLGIDNKPLWDNMTEKVALNFVELWDKEGQLGNFIFNRTGEIAVGGSSSGAIVPAALALAGHYYEKPLYLEKASQIGEYFYRNFTRKGLTTGGPGDAMQNPDSESAFALVVSYMELYEATGKKKWLDYAEQAAKQFATWVISYNYNFPDSSLFGKEDMKSLGAVNANTQNKHGAPHICTHSGLALLKLYRASKHPAYKELLHDIVHGSLQYMGHPSKPIEGVKNGWVCERVSTTDWNEGIGEITYMSTWAETAIMLSHVEIPSLYVEMETGTVTAFDHVEARVQSVNKQGITLQVRNPTKADAELTVLAENQEDMTKPLGQNRLWSVPRIEVPAGQTKTFHIALDKTIKEQS